MIKRNREPSSSTDEQAPEADRIPLPFIIVNSRKETVIDCEMAEARCALCPAARRAGLLAPGRSCRAQDKQEIFFNFSAPFEIHDDNEILKRMQLQYCAALGDLGTMVPASLVPFATAWQQQQQQARTRASLPHRPPSDHPPRVPPLDRASSDACASYKSSSSSKL